MKGDFTRFTFDPKKHYSSVRMQQGRVQLDSDWNEQAEIHLYRSLITNDDVIGLCGAPKHNPGFAIGLSSGELTIGKGRYYVQGTLCQNEEVVPYSNQPDHKPGMAKSNGRYLAYIEAWQRHLTSVEDGDIREVALDGADTASRTKTVWQVKLKQVTKPSDNPEYDCPCIPGARSAGLAVRTGQPGSLDPCILQQGAGYHGLENQLYRVEIHRPGKTGAATFKWSRDNGCIACAVEKIENNRITLKNPDRMAFNAFQPGRLIELIDEKHDLDGIPGILSTVESVSGNVLVVAKSSGITAKDFPLEEMPKVRLWTRQRKNEAASSDGSLLTGTEWIDLEKGIQVRFDPNGDYRWGDYWLIPARRLTGQVEWPDGENEFVPRLGIIRYRCPLAVLEKSGESWSVLKDCRRIFLPLNEIETGGRGSCSVTVGEDGEYAELAEAIEDLIKKHNNDDLKTICICLLPGVHKINSLNVREPMAAPQFNLHIHGCGSSTRLISTGQMKIIGLASIDFANMLIETKDAKDAGMHASGAIFIEGTENISIRSCRIQGEGIPLLRIGPTARHIVISNSFLLPTDVSERFALIIHQVTEDAALTHNWIRGKLSFGPARVHVGPSEKQAQKSGKSRSKKQGGNLAFAAQAGTIISYIWPDLSKQEMGRANDLMRHGLLKLGGLASGTLRMEGNRLTRVLAGDILVEELKELLKAEKAKASRSRSSAKPAGMLMPARASRVMEINSWMFRQVLFSGNIIEEENVALENFNPGFNQIVGKSISMNSNWLMQARGDDNPGKKLLAWAMAESAFYVGNSGPEEVQICDISRTGGKAGNTIEIVECQPAAYHLAYRDSDGWAQISCWEDEWLRRIISTESWEPGCSIVPTTLNALPHILMRGPTSEGNASFSFYRLKAGLDKEKKATVDRERIWSENWQYDPGYSLTPQDIGGLLNLVAYRPSDGDVQLWRRNPAGGKEVIGYGWGPGYEIVPFNIIGEPHFVAYSSGSGSAELYRWTSDGRRETVRSEVWQKGCRLATFEMEGPDKVLRPYLLMYGPKGIFNDGPGRVFNSKLYVWNDDKTRSEVHSHNRIEDSRAMPFKLGGLSYVMTYKEGTQAFEIHRWEMKPASKIDRVLLGTGTIPAALVANITMPFELEKELYFASYDRGKGEAVMCKGSFGGTPRNPVIVITPGQSFTWQKDSLAIAYEVGGLVHFLVYAYETGQVLLSRGMLKDGQTSLETLWTNAWEEKADALMLFVLAGKPNYLVSKQQQQPPVIQLSQWKTDDGSSSIIWSSAWEAGYILHALQISGISLVLAYRPEDGQAEMCTWDSGGVRERIWINSWNKGYTRLLFFEVDGQKAFLAYRPEDGQAEVSLWNPANGKQEVLWRDEWGRNYELATVEADGVSYLLIYRPSDGRAALYRWNSDLSREPVWQEEWGQGYALMPFVLPEEG